MAGELQEKDLLQRHVAEIDAMGPHMARAPKVFIPEVNYGMPDHLPNMLLDVPNLTVWKDPKTGRMGVWKQKGTDQQYRFSVSNALYHGLVRLDEDIFTCSRSTSGDTADVDTRIHMLQSQLERYRYIRKEAADAQFGLEKVKLSGKSGGENDDLVMTFMMAVTWGTVFLLDPRMREQISHTQVGGRYMEVSPSSLAQHGVNSGVLRDAEDAARIAEHDAKWSQRSTTRVQFDHQSVRCM